MRRRMLLIGLWAAITAVAVLVGVFAVSTVGATIRDRGPVGDQVMRDDSVQPVSVPSPEGQAVGEAITGEWGAFDVECRDTWVRRRRPPRQGCRVAHRELGEEA